jgi:glycosyltransferase involved in cell wall biosynthesis
MTRIALQEHQAMIRAEPVVTVITPAYNVEKYIGEAIESVSNQIFQDFEYLLIDDGSVDDTVKIIADYSHRDPRIRIIEAEHSGHSATRNRGIREARGKYIAFLDGDDRWHRRFLDRQVALLEALPSTVGGVFCRSRVILENGTIAFFLWQRAGGYDFDEFLIKNNPSRNGSSLLIRKSCFDEVGGFDEDLPSASDLEMWLRIADKSTSPILWGSKHYLVDWRLRPGSVSKNRLARDIAVLKLLNYHASKLRHSEAWRAYVGPALTALKYGSDDDIAEQMASRAREDGILNLARSVTGIKLLIWHTLPRPSRQVVRMMQSSSRDAIKRVNTCLRGKS